MRTKMAMLQSMTTKTNDKLARCQPNFAGKAQSKNKQELEDIDTVNVTD